MEPPVCHPFSALATLRSGRDVPLVTDHIWSAGSLEGLRRPTIAIVGTRAATAYGKSLARRFACDLANAGCAIVSGLALGIDAAAHQGALDAGAPTIGILGGGHARFFPQRNRALAERMIAAGGAVLSPFPPEHAAFPSQFLQRNGIVAALADAVVVIEAPARSGSLNTAGWAAGRIPVFAVPGDVDRAHVAGCHALIRDGAILARSAQDITDDLRLTAPAEDRASRARELDHALGDELEHRLQGLLSDGERSLDELLDETRVDVAKVLAALSRLEVRGSVEARPGQRYSLR
ncbi:MAG TPA: DNA-processing protein DprA [Candidatus Baltobacteraceae bacterium]|nr:DNA-processing protein DprA [Candidatus Baltobacteraceae bacterium]